jgi:hypothetical protein
MVCYIRAWSLYILLRSLVNERESNCLRNIRETVRERGERATMKGVRWGSSCLGARMLAL